ncbi:hypothetical protein MP228_006092 [Amoeboaphelidium protococcarum]|nr:hypothetical protein MP228_006092 [Amoeboaphelidium protococcarum]
MPTTRSGKQSNGDLPKDAPLSKKKTTAEIVDLDHKSTNYFLFTDMTPNSSVLWVSPSVTDLTGFTQEEMIGKSSYAFFHPDEIEAIQRNHVVNLSESVIARIMTVRFLNKSPDGQLFYRKMDFLINTCYDCCVVVGAHHEFNANSISFRQSAEDIVKIGPQGLIEVENWSTRKTVIMQMLSDTLTWENQADSLKEPRVCLILNRYTYKATIMFASMGSQEVLEHSDQELIGQSFFDFIINTPSDESHGISTLERVRHDVDYVKSCYNVHHLSFDWQSSPSPVHCEAVMTATWDGIVCVIRRKT